jgi:hypothetical protein
MHLDAHRQKALYNVLRAFSVYNPDIGYCQGMGFITALALMYMPEDDAFWFLMRLAEDYNMGGLWLPEMPLINQIMYVMDVLMAEYLPRLNSLMVCMMCRSCCAWLARLTFACIGEQEASNISKAMFVPQFFITGFMYSLPFGLALRIWDSFLSRDFDFLYAVALALFKVYEGITLRRLDRSIDRLGSTVDRNAD